MGKPIIRPIIFNEYVKDVDKVPPVYFDSELLPTIEANEFTLPEPLHTQQSEKSEALKQTCSLQAEPLPRIDFFDTIKNKQPENWEQNIAELETYFSSIELPTQPIKLNQCSRIINVSLFIESHLATARTNNGKRVFLPYLNRLHELKNILKSNVNSANAENITEE